jgi:hypothetical protein
MFPFVLALVIVLLPAFLLDAMSTLVKAVILV